MPFRSLNYDGATKLIRLQHRRRALYHKRGSDTPLAQVH
jgi:hypothetical protein